MFSFIIIIHIKWAVSLFYRTQNRASGIVTDLQRMAAHDTRFLISSTMGVALDKNLIIRKSFTPHLDWVINVCHRFIAY